MPKILILDDASATARLIEDRLEEERYETRVVTDLDEALAGLRKKKWPFDLVIFDFWFTRITGGYEIFTVLQKEYPHKPRILFSKVRWALNTYRTPEDKKDLALEHFQEIEKAQVPIVDKVEQPSPESLDRDMGDAIEDLVKRVNELLTQPEVQQ